jgi:hypothetical protein
VTTLKSNPALVSPKKGSKTRVSSNSKPSAASSSSKTTKPRTTFNSRSAGYTEPLKIDKTKRPATTPADLQRKIKQVEQQLSMASSSSFMDPPSSQTPDPKSFKMTNERRMVTPGSRDAPKFSADQPEGLRRFVRLMEDLWKEAGVTEDSVKKRMIGKYADEDSEEEWAAFTSYGDGHSWPEFKKELIENYPEAAAAERGTPSRIRQLCAETSKVRLGDMPALYRFRRAFMAEAKKLQKPPEAMSNRELVELFIGCLSDSFASAVLQLLGSKSPSEKADGKKSGSDVPRRPEDRYDLEDICKAALQVSENSQGMFSLMRRDASSNTNERGVLMFNQPISETKALTEKVDELESVQALERDRLVSVTKTMESKMTGLEEMMKTLLAQSQPGPNQGVCKGDCRGNNCKTHEASSAPAQRWGGRPNGGMDNEKCFWCGVSGHFQADCDDLKNQVRSGNVKINPEGRLRLKDGSFIPNYPVGATMKEKVERDYARKPSQYYYGEYEEADLNSPMVPKYAQYLGAADDAEKRVARLEAELELRKREDALEQRKRKLEQEEKKLAQTKGNAKSTNVLDLLGQLSDEEVVAIKASRLGFP